MDNPSSAGYLTLDKEEMTFTAEGKPKVLIFLWHADNSRKTMQSISAQKLSGVDIYAIDPWGTEEQTRDFVEQYVDKDSNIKIVQNQDALMEAFKYVEAVDGMSSINDPVIVYIDADNKLQNVTRDKSRYFMGILL